MIREEHMDLFGNSSQGVYYYDKSVVGLTSSNVLDLGSDKATNVPIYNLFMKLTETAADGTSLTFEIQACNDKTFPTSGGAATANPTKTFMSTGAVVTADLVKDAVIFDVHLPKNFGRYWRVKVTAVGTFTAGKVFGNVQPLF